VEQAFDEADGRQQRDEAEDDAVREAEDDAGAPGPDDCDDDCEPEDDAEDAERCEEFHDENLSVRGGERPGNSTPCIKKMYDRHLPNSVLLKRNFLLVQMVAVLLELLGWVGVE